jgi:ubiquitin carboxyl-terminal hydrolase 34
VSFFWKTFVSLIPVAARLGRQTEQFFGIALEIFRSVNEEAQAELPLESYLQDWSKLLLDHRHDEV